MRLFGEGFIVCGVLVVVTAALMMGAGILRGAVSLANKTLGLTPRRPRVEDLEEELDEWIGYRRRVERELTTATAIPEPGLGKGMLVVLVLGIVAGVINALLGEVAEVGFLGRKIHDDGAMLMFLIVSVILTYVPAAAIVSSFLPTSFGRACLVLLYHALIILCIVAVVAAVLGVLFG